MCALVCVCACIPQFVVFSTVQLHPPRLHCKTGARESHLVRLAWEHAHYRHFPSLSFSFSHAHTLTSLHACTQCSPHHKLMSHYSVISVLFPPPCLSAICHSAGTAMKTKQWIFTCELPLRLCAHSHRRRFSFCACCPVTV